MTLLFSFNELELTFSVLISTVGEWKADNIEYEAILNQFDIKKSEYGYALKVISGDDDELIDSVSNDALCESAEIGAAETVHGKSRVEIASGETGYLFVDDEKYTFSEDGIYVGVYNNNTNQMVDVVKIVCRNEEIQLTHIGG